MEIKHVFHLRAWGCDFSVRCKVVLLANEEVARFSCSHGVGVLHLPHRAKTLFSTQKRQSSFQTHHERWLLTQQACLLTTATGNPFDEIFSCSKRSCERIFWKPSYNAACLAFTALCHSHSSAFYNIIPI